MKLVGAILLTAGFLGGAYVAVSLVDSVNWMHYAICGIVMMAGMVALRVARAAEMEQAGEKHAEDINVLQASLASLIEKVRGFEAAESDEDQLAMHHRIDDELLGDIDTFVDARESMIPKLGMQHYADIMSPFANGERLLNRAWSASADGYVDEVRACIQGARVQLETAARLLGDGASSQA